MSDTNAERPLRKVVVNDEEQYSVWRADRDNPPGWRDAGKTGSEEECLDYIKTVWTDLRPMSIRRSMTDTNGT